MRTTKIELAGTNGKATLIHAAALRCRVEVAESSGRILAEVGRAPILLRSLTGDFESMVLEARTKSVLS